MPDTTWLASARLTLCRPSLDDLDAVYAIHSNPETYRHLPTGAMTHLDQARQRLREWLQHWDEHGFGYAVVQPSGDAIVLGFAGPQHAVLMDRPVLNLYYRFDPTSWGHGFATEAVTAVVEWAAATHPGLPLVARIATNNPSSIRLAERAGLTRQNVVDPTDEVEHLIFSTQPLLPA